MMTLESESNDASSLSGSNDTVSTTAVPSSDEEIRDNCGKRKLKFKITLSPDEWRKIKPTKITYKDKRGSDQQRTYEILRRRAWTHVINEYFWSETKLPCKLSYSGGKVAISEVLPAITIRGQCCYCKANLYGFLEKLPVEGEYVTFNCNYRGNFYLKHPTLKRNLAGIARERAVEKLLGEHVSPLAYRQNVANEVMVFGDNEPSHLPTLGQLRDAKSKEVKKRRLDLNPILSIAQAMHAYKFKNIIRDVSYDKFQVRYHSSAQIHVYKNFCKNNRPISVALDATGGVVKRIKRAPGVKSGPIFLYNLVVRESKSKKIYPLYSLLSERHDTETLRHWLTNFLRCRVPLPTEVVTDMSSALMSASVQAFTSYPSLEAYINRCAQLLNINSETPDLRHPECYVRNDVAHLVKLMATWESFRGCIKVTKQFYMRSLCQVLQSKDLEEIKTLLYDIMTVAKCRTEGQDRMGQPTPCETSKQTLIKRIGGLFTSSRDGPRIMEDDEEEEEEPSENSYANQLLPQSGKRPRVKRKRENNPFYKMVNDIKEKIDSQMVDGDRGNQQYLPGLIKHILDISPLIPLWTAVMVPVFGYGGITASSAAVEADFNILKNVLFQNKTLPMRVDDFIFHHITAIEGAMKIAAAESKQTDDVLLSSEYESSSDNRDNNDGIKDSSKTMLKNRLSELKHEEDWGGLVKSQPTTNYRRHQSYLQPSPELSMSDLTKAHPKLPIGLIKNGNRESLQPVQLSSGLKVTLTNTCAFDSLLQLFAIAFCDSVEFQSNVEHTSNPFIGVVKDFVRKGVTKKTYIERAEILQPLTQNVKLPQEVVLLKCETPITVLVSKVLDSEPSVFEASTCDQNDCPKRSRNINRVPVSITVNGQELKNLQSSIEKELNYKKTKCFQVLLSGGYCQGNRILKKEVNNYILLEPIQMDQSRLLQCILKVREIPTKMNIRDKEYILRGCIGFIGSDNVNEIGHYVAYVRRCDGCWETFNDLFDKKLNSVTKEEIKCHLILYSV